MSSETKTDHHHEKHFNASHVVRDVVIGMADGLTVPFALAAGLTGAISQTHLIITAGLAEIAAGSIAMGLGGYLAAHGDEEYYASEMAREEREIVQCPEVEVEEVREACRGFGLSEEESELIANSLKQRPKDWVAFMMRFELGLEKPSPGRAWKSATTIAASYIVGGIIPLSAYWITNDTHQALKLSAATTLTTLAVFGGLKGHFTGAVIWKCMLQTVVTGGLAAAAAFGLARWIN